MDRQQELGPPKQEEPPTTKPVRSNKDEDYLGILCYAAFIILEASFAVLAFYCWWSPRRLPYVDVKPMSIKSAFQTIFNLWHNIAIALAGGICAEAFSKEWAAHQDSPTDTVSKVTSGMIDRIVYFFKSRATRTYRTAFLASLILILMHITSSSTITVSSGVEFREGMPIGLLSDVDLSADLAVPNVQGFVERLTRAGIVVRLEKLGGSPWGLSPEPNWLIPLPSAIENTTGLVYYNTDLARFQHDCNWRAPDSVNDTTYLIDGQEWSLQLNSLGEDLSRVGPGSTIRQLWPPDPISNVNGTSVYLFLGGNSTISVNTTNINDSWIDLSGLPTLYNPSQFIAYHPISPVVDWVTSPLATLLVCQPGLNLTTGYAWIVPSLNVSAPDVTVYDVGTIPPLGNIIPEAAHLLFSTALYTASNEADQVISEQAINWINFNSIASKLFMPEPPSGDWRNSSGVQPRSLDTINPLVDDYKISALKAFTTGYRPESAIVRVQGVFSKPVEALYVDNGLALATSPHYAVLHVVLATTEGILLLVLVMLNLKQNRLPFDLAHLKEE
ncbi:hypothetical protein P691DRAFT_726742 [Macrolepiota fuliginosa MF-IS2]|uniref:Uncharacterized protein n=1 Tax=Macrolepiota fuliginosa MF-IS2 TaxID=1400762 RepID=A0A9P6C6C8_9AGAR|nr:hypothetical protein P691DRAFT_726742 [Macrolepiota fuliginosa MF-IS2]